MREKERKSCRVYCLGRDIHTGNEGLARMGGIVELVRTQEV